MKMATTPRSAGNRSINGGKLTIILFGKTGNGKSSVGNTILSTGESGEQFPVGSGLASTSVDFKEISTLMERVIDIPDFTNLGSQRDRVIRDIKSLQRQVSRTPYVILLAIRCDVRYTKEEYDIYTEFKAIWGGLIRDHLVVAFTFRDRQDRDIKEDLKKANRELKSVLRDANKRYVVFNDKLDKQDKERVVMNLMTEIRKMQRRETTGCRFCTVL